MFCPHCGKELPDDAQFCMKCGHALPAEAPASTVAPAPSPAPAPAAAPPATVISAPAVEPKSGGRNKWGLKLVGVLVFIAVVWILGATVSQFNHDSGADPGASQNLPQPQSHVITDGALTVAAMEFSYYPITVPAGATNVSVDGHFTATGGAGNDIEVYVFNEDEFVNFKNGHSTQTFYNSGKVTQDSIQAMLPGSGNYYLVFNNNFSLLTPKAVQATATLHYTMP